MVYVQAAVLVRRGCEVGGLKPANEQMGRVCEWGLMGMGESSRGELGRVRNMLNETTPPCNECDMTREKQVAK